jgi:hypothetical protein
VHAHRWLNANKEAAIDFLAKEIPLQPELARRGWEYYTTNRIQLDGEIPSVCVITLKEAIDLETVVQWQQSLKDYPAAFFWVAGAYLSAALFCSRCG